MSRRKSLAERRQMQQQKKARVAQEDAKLSEAERKARTQRLIKAGGLVEKAGLLDLDANALYGFLLPGRLAMEDEGQVELWAAAGGRAFAEEEKRRDESKEGFVIVFPAPLCKKAAAEMRRAGFRFSEVYGHWEAKARFEEARSLATAHGGIARKVDGDRASESPLTANEPDAGSGKGRAAGNGAGHGPIPPARTEQSSLFGEDQV